MTRPRRLGPALVAAAGLAYALAAAPFTPWALKGAGLTGDAPEKKAGAIKAFIDTIADNALWFCGTIVTLAIVGIGALFLLGHTRAQDYAARAALGVMLLISAGAIAA